MATPLIADVQISTLATFHIVAKERLLTQRRVFNRLDWWLPQEWFDSKVFWGIGSSDIDAAILISPISMSPHQDDTGALCSTAWLRWCAVADDVSASGVMPRLFQYSRIALKRLGVRRVYCIVEPVHWIMPYLDDAGFKRVDDVITLLNRPTNITAVALDSAMRCQIRQASPKDLAAVHGIDVAAFDEEWQYPVFVLEKALRTFPYFAVVEVGGQIVGYLFAVINDREAHITRLAVHPNYQGRNIGSQLLQVGIAALRADYGVSGITLNTQATNNISQKLYKRNGFKLLQPTLRVMCMHCDD